MTASDSTRWSLIAGAAEGRESDRAEFARHYAPVIRSYLRARWRHFPLAADVDDAAQEVFLDCFKDGGALTRADPDRSFRAFLYGVTRNVARRMEERWAGKREREHVAGGELLEDLAAREEPLSQVFDRAWALGMMAQAAELQGERARAKGGDAERRVRLLQLRFTDELPIREIARQWEVDPARLHHEYAKAREEFKAALREVVRLHHDGAPPVIEAECARLLAHLK